MENGDLEHLSNLADARLGVAEEVGWYAAVATALLVGVKLEWWVGVIALYPIYYIVTLRFRNAAAKAEEAYFRDAKIGRYGYLRDKSSDARNA